MSWVESRLFGFERNKENQRFFKWEDQSVNQSFEYKSDICSKGALNGRPTSGGPHLQTSGE